MHFFGGEGDYFQGSGLSEHVSLSVCPSACLGMMHRRRPAVPCLPLTPGSKARSIMLRGGHTSSRQGGMGTVRRAAAAAVVAVVKLMAVVVVVVVTVVMVVGSGWDGDGFSSISSLWSRW